MTHRNSNQLAPAYAAFTHPNSKECVEEDYFKIDNLHVLESERVRIGHELHDSVNPLLAVAQMYMSLINTSTKKEAQVKKEAITFILEAIENIRHISSDLVISQNEDFDLPKVVAKLVKRINGTSIFNVHLKISDTREISKLDCSHKLTLYRIVQEQLNNIIKYSKASLVKIDFACVEGVVKLIVKDDGIGFDPKKSATGIGLKNIEKRVSEFKGFVKIISSPGNGCSLNVAFEACKNTHVQVI